MYILSNRKAYLEFYDVVKEKDADYMQLMDALGAEQAKYDHLEDFAPDEAWYDSLLAVASFKSCTAKDDADIDQMLLDSLRIYLDHSKAIPDLSDEARAEKIAVTREYTDGLIDHGGVSTDVFKKELGADATRKFFDTVMFGTAVE